MPSPGNAAPTAWPEHIRARYGITERPRWQPWLVAGLGLSFLALVTFLGLRLSRAEIRAGVLAYETVAADHMRLEFEVLRRDQAPATCILRARASDGFDVAYTEVVLPPAEGRTRHSYELRTAYRALVGELLGCGTTGPPPGIPGAQYRPGVLPPVQPWTPATS